MSRLSKNIKSIPSISCRENRLWFCIRIRKEKPCQESVQTLVTIIHNFWSGKNGSKHNSSQVKWSMHKIVFSAVENEYREINPFFPTAFCHTGISIIWDALVHELEMEQWPWLWLWSPFLYATLVERWDKTCRKSFKLRRMKLGEQVSLVRRECMRYSMGVGSLAKESELLTERKRE